MGNYAAVFQPFLYLVTLQDLLERVRWPVTGPPPKPGEPHPITPSDLVSQAVAGLLLAGGNTNPDSEGDGTEVDGPAGPVIHVLVGVTIFRLASRLRSDAATAVRSAAADLVSRGAEQMKAAMQ